MACVFNKLTIKLIKLVRMQTARYSNRANHWSVIKKKKTAKDVALKHFDEFYGNVYGRAWENIRTALLMKQHKYMAVVNSFSDTDRIKSELESCGAMNLKDIYHVYKQDFDARRLAISEENEKDNAMSNQRIERIVAETQMSAIQSYYPADALPPTSLNISDEQDDIKQDIPLQPVEMKSIETDLNEMALDENRIILPNAGLNTLYEFVPATKLKGLEDWVLESEHYNFYKQGADFSVDIKEELVLTFPDHLNIYTFEKSNNDRFPSPKKGSTGVLDYYLLDGASILPVLALDLQFGDAVLDMCAAPGGKALTILQTFMPRLLVANDDQRSRVYRIHRVINEYIAGIGQWKDKLFITNRDARIIDEKDVYNKILVDVPCTTDRHVLHTDENNLFKSTRLRERLRIPQVQAEILTNALKLIPVNGTVVYSTCTLSPIQNGGVVGMALKKVWEETDSVMVVKDMRKALQPLKYFYKIGNFGLKYGHIAIPTIKNNWGPMYFCKIVRTR